jgi:hypothetical protein
VSIAIYTSISLIEQTNWAVGSITKIIQFS